MGSVNVVFLHGFLGEPADFKPIIDGLVPCADTIKIYTPHLYEKELGPHTLLRDWGEKFASWWDRHDDGNPLIIVGYSMGGRLAASAIEAIEARPFQMILISSFVGLSKEPGRLADDKKWATVFENEHWGQALHLWNHHPTLQTSQTVDRYHLEKYRHQLSLCLTNWSQALQADQHPILRRNADRIQYLVGSKDVKYLSYAQEIAALGIAVRVVENSGHRIIVDQPAAVVTAVSALIF